MTLDKLYDDELQYADHMNVIEQLEYQAQAHGLDTAVVRPMYEAELAKLRKTAKITSYLSILVSNAVMNEIFQNGHHDSEGSMSENDPTSAMTENHQPFPSLGECLSCPYDRRQTALCNNGHDGVLATVVD